MKIFIIVTLVLYCGQKTFSQLPCGISCRDVFPTMMCKMTLILKKCDGRMSIVCMKTCGKCTSCTGPRTLSLTNSVPEPECNLGPCVDTKPFSCPFYVQTVKDGCKIVGNECKASCSLCKTCALPPTEKPCTNECVDSDKNTCAYWKKEGYCDIKKGFPHTRIACPLSCETCKLCPTTTTKVPPTTTTTIPKTTKITSINDCSKCEDQNEHCLSWKNDGYCDASKGFPDTRKACKKSCGICTTCSDQS